MLSIPPPLSTATYYLSHHENILLAGASHLDQHLSYTMPKLCCCVDCGKIAAAAVAVNTSVGVGDSGPPTAPFDSA
eukprot:scaffold14427_cov94-Skeletonema_dohrnii-CCMP3373.AAC.2